MPIAQPNPYRNTWPANPLDVFQARALAVSKLLANHLLADKATAVDGLWRFAQASGLWRSWRRPGSAILAEAFSE